MDWRLLLTPARLGQDRALTPDPSRPAYTIDADRITFSSAFRRLQDKTQVFPLADNDYVRTRLTHSLEVASVGRSLGTRVGAAVIERHGLAPDFHASDLGSIIAAAALAHDLGNPPFGHSGEDAIRHWVKNSPVGQAYAAEMGADQLADFERFEGNAQGFRIVSKLQMPDNPGLRLTCATLAAFTKYPRQAVLPPDADADLLRGASAKKFGFFHSECEEFARVAEATGLIRRHPSAAWWCRHPLALLVEAADDISYRLVDFEDGFRLGHLTYAEVSESFFAVTGDDRDRDRAARIAEEKDRIAFLRAQAIGAAVGQCAVAFLDLESRILEGAWDGELLDQIPSAEKLREIKKRSIGTIYATARGVEIEAAGYDVLGGLLDYFGQAATDVALRKKDASPRSRKLLQLVSRQFTGPDGIPPADAATRLRGLTDFVAGMTDTYAVSLYRRLSGISLPGA